MVVTEKQRAAAQKTLQDFFGQAFFQSIFSLARSEAEQDQILDDWLAIMEQRKKIEQESQSIYIRDLESDIAIITRVPVNKDNFCDREFRYLTAIGCSAAEIAGFYQMPVSAFEDMVNNIYGMSFSKMSDILSPGIKVALRRSQIRTALKGNVAMQKFLGKNLLGQSETIGIDHSAAGLSWADAVDNMQTDDNPKSD